jgi:hypothetical protein
MRRGRKPGYLVLASYGILGFDIFSAEMEIHQMDNMVDFMQLHFWQKSIRANFDL